MADALQERLRTLERELSSARSQSARQRIELRGLRELRTDVIRAHVALMLEDPDDFWIFDSEANVLDADGRIDLPRLDARVRDLLRRKPGLAKFDTP